MAILGAFQGPQGHFWWTHKGLAQMGPLQTKILTQMCPFNFWDLNQINLIYALLLQIQLCRLCTPVDPWIRGRVDKRWQSFSPTNLTAENYHLFSWFIQNAKTCWDSPDKMPTKKFGRTKCQPQKKGQTKCQPSVGILSGWHFVLPPRHAMGGTIETAAGRRIFFTRRTL